MAQDLVADAAQVRGPRPQIGVVQRLPRRHRAPHGGVPGKRRVFALVEHPGARRPQQRLVVEEQQVSVEDGGLVVARPPGHRIARPVDVIAGGGEGSLQGDPVGLAIA